ncbi:alpha/beta hydrolase family protein [Caloranaerobacter ferrireducens]|uniref:alpha/beta hydrolase family protein n=1 Tax=Caloranaerobacter ferrireducens TaxID=1323370 RepID=UPI00084D9F37|nr:prolyl oligopeptidase family serine peptidase [Caloranaerobacter ferrireducens]
MDSRKRELMKILKIPKERRYTEYEVLEEKKYETYIIRKVKYKVYGEYIEAYILIPNKEGVFPGILAIHQDGERRPYEFGKSEVAGLGGDKELAYGLELCLRGYVVICPDRFGFESRSLANSKYADMFEHIKLVIKIDYNGKEREIDLSEDLYKGYKANYCLTRGKTQMGVELTELMIAIDILTGMPEVDSERIGVIGHSAGGLLAVYLMYIDERVKVGCSSSGIASIKKDFYPDEGLRALQGFGSIAAIPDILEWGDIEDILEGLAPRPFIELSSDVDKKEYFNKAIKKYEEMGCKECLEYDYYNAGVHIFRKDKREKCYKFIDKWLKQQ